MFPEDTSVRAASHFVAAIQKLLRARVVTSALPELKNLFPMLLPSNEQYWNWRYLSLLIW